MSDYDLHGNKRYQGGTDMFGVPKDKQERESYYQKQREQQKSSEYNLHDHVEDDDDTY